MDTGLIEHGIGKRFLEIYEPGMLDSFIRLWGRVKELLFSSTNHRTWMEEETE